MNKMVGLQALLIGATLVMCLGYPASGRAAMVVAGGDRSSGKTVGWLRDHGAMIVSAGLSSAHPVIRIPDDKLALRALRLGIVLVAVPMAACAGKDTE